MTAAITAQIPFAGSTAQNIAMMTVGSVLLIASKYPILPFSIFRAISDRKNFDAMIMY